MIQTHRHTHTHTELQSHPYSALRRHFILRKKKRNNYIYKFGDWDRFEPGGVGKVVDEKETQIYELAIDILFFYFSLSTTNRRELKNLSLSLSL